MMLPSRLGCPLSLKTPNMGNPGYKGWVILQILMYWTLWDKISPNFSEDLDDSGF